MRTSPRALSDVPAGINVQLQGASCRIGRAGRAHQKGCDFSRRHGPYFLLHRNRLRNRLDVEFFLSRPPMDPREFPLMGRIDAPGIAPEQWVRLAKTYRQAVRLAWQLKRVHYMTRRQLASEAELYPQHVTDYLHEDDKPSRRSLPAEAITRFEAVVGNTLVSQWIASQSKLTVLEEITATRAVA